MLGRTKTSLLWSALKMTVFGVGMIVLGSRIVGCVKKPVSNSEEAKKMTAKTIEEALNAHTDEWMSIPGVVGTAIGEFKGKPCIKILVVRKTEQLKKKIPSQVEGFPVVIEETGEIRALGKG